MDLSPQDRAILDALAAWALDTWLNLSELTIITSDGLRHTYPRPGRMGVPVTLPINYVFAKWERAVQFGARDRALAEQPAFTVTIEHGDEEPRYTPTSEWS